MLEGYVALHSHSSPGTQDLPVSFHPNIGALLNRPMPDLVTLRSWTQMLGNLSDEPELVVIKLIFFAASTMSVILCCGAVYEHIASRRRVAAAKAEMARLMTALLFRDAVLAAG